jgi:hypothetical protein
MLATTSFVSHPTADSADGSDHLSNVIEQTTSSVRVQNIDASGSSKNDPSQNWLLTVSGH